MKRVVAALCLVLALSGCGSSKSGGDSPGLDVISNPHWVDLPDGRKVLCVFEAAHYYTEAGTSCDWEHAK